MTPTPDAGLPIAEIAIPTIYAGEVSHLQPVKYGLRVMSVVRRYRQSPLVQIIRVIEVAKDGRYDIDYWCEICAIAMFEKKDCECCQGDVELRHLKIE